jgi:hypothetical protein
MHAHTAAICLMHFTLQHSNRVMVGAIWGIAAILLEETSKWDGWLSQEVFSILEQLLFILTSIDHHVQFPVTYAVTCPCILSQINWTPFFPKHKRRSNTALTTSPPHSDTVYFGSLLWSAWLLLGCLHWQYPNQLPWKILSGHLPDFISHSNIQQDEGQENWSNLGRVMFSALIGYYVHQPESNLHWAYHSIVMIQHVQCY